MRVTRVGRGHVGLTLRERPARARPTRLHAPARTHEPFRPRRGLLLEGGLRAVRGRRERTGREAAAAKSSRLQSIGLHRNPTRPNKLHHNSRNKVPSTAHNRTKQQNSARASTRLSQLAPASSHKPQRLALPPKTVETKMERLLPRALFIQSIFAEICKPRPNGRERSARVRGKVVKGGDTYVFIRPGNATEFGTDDSLNFYAYFTDYKTNTPLKEGEYVEFEIERDTNKYLKHHERAVEITHVGREYERRHRSSQALKPVLPEYTIARFTDTGPEYFRPTLSFNDYWTPSWNSWSGGSSTIDEEPGSGWATTPCRCTDLAYDKEGPTSKKRKVNPVNDNNTGTSRRPPVYSGKYSGAMKALATWLKLDADAIDGVVATAGASEAAPEPIDGYIEDPDILRLASEALTDATMLAMDLERPLEDGDIRTVGVFHGLVEFLGLNHIDISEEIEGLRTSLHCPPPPLLQSNPAHVEGAKHCAFIAVQLDGKEAFDDGGAAAVYCYTMPMRLIPVAVRALPVDDQAAVAYLLRKERLEYLEGLERPADAPRKCPGCETVVHSVAAARAHLHGTVPCAWKLVSSQIPKDQHHYCRKDCGNPECPRKEGGMWPFLQEHHRNAHEERQGVRFFCDGGCRFGAKCPHINKRPFNTAFNYKIHREPGPTTSRMRLAGYVPGVEVEVDYEGAGLGSSIGDRRRREPFNKRYGRIDDEDGNGNVSILFFDTLETEPFREGYTLNDVLGVLPPYKVAKRKPHIRMLYGKAVLCGTKRKASA